MMNRKMKQLALAVGVALGGAGMLPSAQAVNVSADNLGQTLIFPYYSVRGGWNTLVGVTNTTDQSVAVRVRFREAWDSRDVLDFVLVLSPYDLWNATVYAVDDAGPPVLGINADEDTCTIGLPGKTVPFPTINGEPISYDGSVARMREGYVEMIMMGAGPEAGVPSCATLVQNFMGQGIAYNTALLNLNRYFPNYPASPLKGTFSLVNAGRGYNAVGLPTALANFRDARAITLHQPPTLPPVAATTATQVAYADSWHEPTLNSANTQGRYYNAAGVDTVGGPPAGAGAVTWALQATDVLNEWTRNPDGQTPGGQSFITATDWVVTFPTKNFHVDPASADEYSGRFTQDGLGRPNLPPNPPAPFTSTYGANGSCDTIQPTIFDREENTIDIQYPSPSGRFQLCHEVNVLTFNAGVVLVSPDVVNIPYDPAFLYGWMNIGFNTPGPLPAIGFAITSRQAIDALLTEAALYDHSFVRPVAAPAAP